MRTPRLIAGLVTAGLVGLVPVAVTAPAHAANPAIVTLELDDDSGTADDGIVVYGDEVSMIGKVVDATTGESVYSGTVSLQVSTPAVPAWTEITTANASGFVPFDVKPMSNAKYQLVYSGGASSTIQWTGAASAETPVGVARAIKAKTPGLRVVGKVTPDYKKSKIQVLRKVGKKFKPFKTVKTNKKSRFSVKLPTGKPGKKLYFALAIKGDAEFAPTYDVYYTIRY